MSVIVYEQAGSLINDAAVELGLGEVSDAYGSTDAAVVQLRGLLKKLGRRLLREHEWANLVEDYSWTTDGTEFLQLPPDDFLSIIDGSFWDTTAGREVLPISSAELVALEAQQLSGSLQTYYRLAISGAGAREHIELIPTPASGQVLAMRYRISYWAGEGIAPALDVPSSNAHYVLYDPPLVVAGLVLEFLKAKGFETTHAQRDYDAALASAISHDRPGRTENLAGSRHGVRLIGAGNLPDTGFGS